MSNNLKSTGITVGLFTYQRPAYLQRQLNFFKELNYDFRLIILDGSEEQHFRDQSKSIAQKFNLEYYNVVDFKERHLLFFEKLDTDVASWAADDDLIVPSFFTDGAAFLRENRNYSAIAGRVYTMHYRGKPSNGYYLRSFLDNNYNICDGDLVEKIVRRDQSYALGCPPTFYGVKTYDAMKTFNKHIEKIKLLTSMERLDEIATLLNGGIKVIDTLMGFRDYSSVTTRQAFREDPIYYISKEDTLQLQNVIKEELKEKVKDSSILDYIASYAWPLPLRAPQGEHTLREYTMREMLESKYNLYFAHKRHAFGKDVTVALRKSMLGYKTVSNK